MICRSLSSSDRVRKSLLTPAAVDDPNILIEPFGFFFTQRREVYDLKDVSVPGSSAVEATIMQRVVGQELCISCAEFQPTPKDTVDYKWTDSDGVKRRMEMPHFCLRDIPIITANIQNYINRTKDSYLELIRDDDLLFRTISMAIEYTKTRPVSNFNPLVINLCFFLLYTELSSKASTGFVDDISPYRVPVGVAK